MNDTITHHFTRLIAEFTSEKMALEHEIAAATIRIPAHPLCVQLKRLEALCQQLQRAQSEWDHHLAPLRITPTRRVQPFWPRVYALPILEACQRNNGIANFQRIHHYLLMNVHDVLHDWDFQPDYRTWVDGMHQSIAYLCTQGSIILLPNPQSTPYDTWELTDTGRAVLAAAQQRESEKPR